MFFFFLVERGKCNCWLVLILQNIVLITLQEICFDPIKKKKKKVKIALNSFHKLLLYDY